MGCDYHDENAIKKNCLRIQKKNYYKYVKCFFSYTNILFTLFIDGNEKWGLGNFVDILGLFGNYFQE